MSHSSFPAVRMRRSRASSWCRSMVAEHSLAPSDLIWPLFIAEGEGVEEPISALPGVSRWSIDLLVERAREARDLGIPASPCSRIRRASFAPTMRWRR
jgi:porphobilinogen synthase